jgi:hypothetical protein
VTRRGRGPRGPQSFDRASKCAASTKEAIPEHLRPERAERTRGGARKYDTARQLDCHGRGKRSSRATGSPRGSREACLRLARAAGSRIRNALEARSRDMSAHAPQFLEWREPVPVRCMDDRSCFRNDEKKWGTQDVPHFFHRDLGARQRAFACHCGIERAGDTLVAITLEGRQTASTPIAAPRHASEPALSLAPSLRLFSRTHSLNSSFIPTHHTGPVRHIHETSESGCSQRLIGDRRQYSTRDALSSRQVTSNLQFLASADVVSKGTSAVCPELFRVQSEVVPNVGPLRLGVGGRLG